MSGLLLDRRQLFSGGAGALALVGLPAYAQPVVARRDNLGWDQLQAFLNSFATDKKLPGLVAAVARGTDDASFLMTGTIAADSTRAMDPDSLFRVYSMTKPITAMAAMMLIEDGRLGLDQDIGDVLPLFKNPRVAIDLEKDLRARPAVRAITPRHLMTHTAGLGYIITSKGPLLKAYADRGLIGGLVSRKPIPGIPDVKPAPGLETFANRIAGLPLIADPGTKWSYSAGLEVLGRVIEVVSGLTLDRFLQTRIFDPLGMTSSFFQVPQSELPRLVTNYGIGAFGRIALDSAKDSVYADRPPILFGGGGLVMSPRDYDRFLLMLAGYGAVGRTRVMKTETAKLAMSNLLPDTADTKGSFVEGQGFGAGGRVVIKGDVEGRGVGTFGWGGAAATIGWVDPVRGLRASGFAQYMPDGSIGFPTAFSKAVYASL